VLNFLFIIAVYVSVIICPVGLFRMLGILQKKNQGQEIDHKNLERALLIFLSPAFVAFLWFLAFKIFTAIGLGVLFLIE